VAQLEFDEQVAKQLEVVYATRDLLRRRALVREALGAQPGERIVDVGCGPGFYVAELLDEVGAEGSLTAVDSSASMLALAAARCEDHDNVDFHEADATELPLADASFDAALSVQVQEYVEEIATSLGEIHRVLRPGGRAVIWDVDWPTLSMRTADPGRMRRMLDAWDEHLADPALPSRLTAELRAAGFEDVTMEGHVFATNELIPDAYGGFLVPFLKQFVVDAGTADEDEAEAWLAEQQELDTRGEFYLAITQFSFAATKPA